MLRHIAQIRGHLQKSRRLDFCVAELRTRLTMLLVCCRDIENQPGPRFSKVSKFYGSLWVSQFPLYLKNGEDLSHQTSQLFFFLLP